MSQSRVKCPVEGCSNEVDVFLENGELYWVDKVIPFHRGKVDELSSPYKEMFIGYAYEKGILKKEEEIIHYTTRHLPVSVHTTYPYESIYLFLIGVTYLIFSFFPFNIFSHTLLYILGGFFVILSILHYYHLR